MDHARAYLESGKKNEGGVIAGVVFEDTIRRLARDHQIQENDINLDFVISALASEGVISSALAKRARAAAHVRTKATHAKWDEFEIQDAKAAIALTDELILKNLA